MQSKSNRAGFVSILVPFLTAALLCGATPAWSSDVEDPAKTGRPKIGLVLSGGGARGAAHVGVIKVLEELHIPIDYIAGTSMGSIVGGLYASGITIEEVENILKTIDWDDTLDDNPPREDKSFRRKRDDDLYLVKMKPGFNDGKIEIPTGLLQGQKIDLLFEALTLPVSKIESFDDLSIPFRAVATDIVTGGAVVLGSGSLGRAMRASMSVPGGFAPVEIGGHLLVDGGVANNLPIDVVRDMGADIVIAVDISTPLKTRDELVSALAITGQLAGILTRRNTEEQIATLSDRDVFIVPDLGDITTAEFERAAEAIPKGVVAAEAKRSELAKLSLPEPAFTRHVTRHKHKRVTDIPVIEFIRIENDSPIGNDVIAGFLSAEIGEPLDVRQLEADIGRIYGLELFSTVLYDVVTEDGQTGLVIQARRRSWGPNYLQFGIALAGREDGDNSYNVAVSILKTGLNALGGEVRLALQVGEEPGVALDYYQPLDVNMRYFVRPLLSFGKNNINVFDDRGNILADYRTSQYTAEISAGRELGVWGQFRLGYRRSGGSADVRVGDTSLPDFDFDGSEIFASFSLDELDNLNFPRHGTFFNLGWTGSREDLGADDDFDQITFNGLAAKTWDRNTIFGRLTYNTTLDSDAPIQNLFRAGGLFDLSGFKQGELTGQHFGLLGLGYFRRIGDFHLFPMYLGADIEVGNVWQNKGDIGFDDSIVAGTLFLGIDSPLGPVYLGLGHAEGGNSAAYFFVGEVF